MAKSCGNRPRLLPNDCRVKSIDGFVRAMQELFALQLDDAERWRRVGTLLPLLLDDPELRASAKDWPTTQSANAATNLLFYEDPERKFVINALVKDPHAATPIHDHAHTWTAYGVIEGSERVLRYAIAEGDRNGERAVLEPAGEYIVAPGYVDVVPPHEPHAEIAGDGRTVAVIVRSERVGGFPQNMYDLATGRIERRPGPASVPHAL
jgi:predicted metal-dependent enzyme (double-stranded beta helix superfamily)